MSSRAAGSPRRPSPSCSAPTALAGGNERTEVESRDLLRAGGVRLARVITTRSFTHVIEGIAEAT
jgi:hypothetical protein